MSKVKRYGGKTLQVDRVEEIFGDRGQSRVIDRLKAAANQAVQQRDMGELRRQLGEATQDGVITAQEKPGLKREWAALESAYLQAMGSYRELGGSEDSATYTLLQTLYKRLSSIMERIFSDMAKDYSEGDVGDITDLFIQIYSLLSALQGLIDRLRAESAKWQLEITGEREIVTETVLSARLWRLDGDTWADVTQDESFAPSEFLWTMDGVDGWRRSGKSCTIGYRDFYEAPQIVSLSLSHSEDAGEGNAVSVSLVATAEVKWGTKKEWCWSDAEDTDSLLRDPSKVWRDTPGENTYGKRHLWRRETSDLRKAENEREWLYFRETGLQGPAGESGVIFQLQRSESRTEPPDKLVYYKFGARADGSGERHRYMVWKGRRLGDFDQSDWETGVPPETPQKPYLWLRWSTDGGRTWSDPICVTGSSGESTRDFQIHVSSLTYQVTERGTVPEDTEIRCWITRQNIPLTASTIAKWRVVFTDSEEEAVGDECTITVPKGYRGRTVEIYCTVREVTYSQILRSVGEQLPKGRKLSPRPVDPEDPSTFPSATDDDPPEPIWPGDYFMGMVEDAETGETVLVPYIWATDGGITGWMALDGTRDAAYYDILKDLATDALSRGDAITSESVLNLFAQNFFASDAAIRWLRTERIQLADSGVIYGGSYDERGNRGRSGKGFHLSAEGLFQCTEGFLENVNVTGSFECVDSDGTILATRRGTEALTVSIATSPWRFSFQDFRKAFEESGKASMPVLYRGHGLTCRRTWIHFFSDDGGKVPTDGTGGETFTCPVTGDYRLIAVWVQIQSYWWDNPHSISRVVHLERGKTYTFSSLTNGWKVSYPEHGQCYFKQARLEPERSGILFLDSAGAAIDISGEETSFFDGEDDVWIDGNAGGSMPTLCDAQVSSDGAYSALGSVFSSNTAPRHYSVGSLATSDNGTALEANRSYPAASGQMVTYNGEQRRLVSLHMENDGSFIVSLADMTLSCALPEGKARDRRGWYRLEGKGIRLIASERGLYAQSLYPASKDSSSIGSVDEPYTYVHAKSLIAYESLRVTGTASATGTVTSQGGFVGNVNGTATAPFEGNRYVVWGAVAN